MVLASEPGANTSYDTPYVSIVINTSGKNLPGIRRFLYSVKLQSYENYEIIVATESNGIEIRRICEEFGLKCIVVETGFWNRCITGNIGILRSKGELIAILEDDVVLEPSWLAKLVTVLASDKDIGCAYSAVINPFGSESIVTKTSKRVVRFMVKALNTLRVHYHFTRKKLNVFSLTVICRKEALLKAGLFDMSVEEPIVAEDYDLAIRVQKAGFRVVTISDAKAYHYSRHAYKRTLLALDRGPKWWEKLVENDTYFFAKHHDLLGPVVIMHAIYNAFFSPLGAILRTIELRGQEACKILVATFLRSIKGSFTGLIKGLMKRRMGAYKDAKLA
jgi:GT2 family glycosyltransferase